MTKIGADPFQNYKTKVENTLLVVYGDNSIHYLHSMPKKDYGYDKRIDQNLKKDVLAFIDEYLTWFSSEEYPDRTKQIEKIDSLRTVGQDLFDRLIPGNLKKEILRWNQKTKLCISSNNDWIPWEILHDGSDYLGNRFFIYRLPRVNGNEDEREKEKLTTVPTSWNKSQESSLKKLIHVIGGNLDGFEDGANRFFTDLNEGGKIVLHTIEKKGFSVLKENAIEADIIHFTCHGRKDRNFFLQITECSDDPALMNLSLLSFARSDFVIREGCLIFANACSSAAAISCFEEFSSFGSKFINMGAGYFIGTLGGVPIHYAIEFSNCFYNNLIINNDISRSFETTKLSMDKKRNQFHLLYVIYGNPAIH